MKTATVLIIAIVAQAAGDVFLTRGMKSIPSLDVSGGGLSESLSQVSHIAFQAMQSPMIWIGTLLLIIFFVLYSSFRQPRSVTC